jgi:hypothetical protein
VPAVIATEVVGCPAYIVTVPAAGAETPVTGTTRNLVRTTFQSQTYEHDDPGC